MKKSIFLFFAAILCAMSANAAYYFHGSKTGNDWPGKEMTKSADGYYYYYEVTSGTHEFKITSKQDWSGTEYTTVLSKYNGTDVAVTGGNGSNCKITNCTSTHYVIIYPKSTLINNTTNYYVCASSTLPNGFGAIHFKHPWNGGSWTYQTATNNGDGTFSYVGKYGNAGVNWCVQKNGTGEKYIETPTLVGSPVTGDDCTFTFNGADQTITITKKVNKNIGDITITMNCTQQPKIFFWDVEGKTCAEWPGEDMVAAGANTYTYTFEDVDVDLGVNYKINLKAVNENEWETGNLHTTTDITHTAADLNIPTIGMHGNFIDGWQDTEKFTVSDDYTSATLTLEGITEGDHEFGMQINGSWTSNGKTFTRNANSAEVKSGSGNLKLTADYTGNYIFTYTYKTQTLEVTYPELPTPEYEDITIQVYAKQVPNIWWWNGGDQCPSTEDIVNPSTGNKYQWNEAPAMEKVAGEDNWYTKTFTQVDITKGGIKFKLQSTDHSTSTTNEVVTTENKCYDARVIATVTETTCGELPSGEVPTVTYNVTVPTGTPACYIAGAMNGWSHQAMTKVDETHYTITIEGAQKTQEYKYSASNNWDLVELNEDGSEKSNRTWTENDVVAKWAKPAVITYALMGVGSDWTTGITMTYDEENNQYVLTNQSISKATDAVKVAKLSDGSPVEWYNTVDSYSCAHEMVYDGFDSENIVLEDGTYDFYFKLSNNEIYIEKDPVTIDVTLSNMVKSQVPRTMGRGYTSLDDAIGNSIQIYNESAEWAYGEFTVTGELVAYGVTVQGNGTWAVVDGVETLTATLQVEDDNTTIYNVVATVAAATTITLECYDATYTITDPEFNEVTFTGVADGKEFSILVSYFGGEYYSEGEWGETFIMGTEVDFDDSDAEEYYLGGTYIDDASNTYQVRIFGTPAVVEPTPDYTRTTTAGKFGTICLPFGSTNYTGMELFECVGQETGKVYIASVTTLEAGVPYIFQATATELAVYSDGTAASAGNHNGLVGTFVDETVVAAGDYILLNNELRPSNGEAKVNANRAYLVMSDVPVGAPQQMPGRRYIGMSVQGENEATGFENITNGENTTIKLIENGQLIIIRNGEKFNAQGVRF